MNLNFTYAKFRCIHLVEIVPVALKKKKCENFTDDQTDRETDRLMLLNNWQKMIKKAHSAKNYRIFMLGKHLYVMKGLKYWKDMHPGI